MSTRITDLPQAETLNGSEVMPLVQNGVTKHATLDFINQAAPAALILQQTQQAYANTVVLHDETEALKTEFEAQYLGSFPAPPVLNNDGSTLTVGAIYWNTSISSMYVWNGAEWTAFSSPSMRVHAQRFSGDGIQTDFLMTLGVSSASLVDVFINGIYQNKNTFTVEDTLISFSEPPPSGTENVEVLIAIATAIGETDASLVSYKVTDDSETVRTVQSKLREFVSVKDFGAVGDGVTDDTEAVQAAIDAAINELHFEDNKTYCISSALNINKSNLRIIGRGATLDGSAQPASVSLSDRFALRVEGAWAGAAISVSGAVAEGAVALTVSSTSGLSAGDLALVYSISEFFPANATGTSTYKGSLHRIRSIDSGTTLTLSDGVLYDYTSATDTRVRKITPVENVHISNLNVVMGGLNKAHCGIFLRWASNVTLMDCSTDQTEDTGVRLEYVYHGRITGGRFTNANDPADGTSGVTGNTGCAVCVSAASRNFVLEKAFMAGCRHAVTGGAFHPPAHILVKDCVIAGNRSSAYATSYALDCHEDTIYWTFDGNHVSGANTTTGTGGILIRGQHAKVVNNTITNVQQHGILVQSFDNPGVLIGANIRGNTITRPRLNGICVIGSSAAEVFDLQIIDNNIVSPGAEGIEVRGTTRGVIKGTTVRGVTAASMNAIRLVGTAATAGNQNKDITIVGNAADSATDYAVRADWANGLVIADNEFSGITLDVLRLVNCSNVAVSGNKLETNTSSRSAVYLDSCVGVAVSGGTFRNTVAASGTSSGVYILGASTDIAVTGINARSFNRGVYSVSPANFISVAGVNCRTCTTASVDISASANTAVAGNL